MHSTRNTPRTMNPMRGQESASGRPIKSGTDTYLAAATSGSVTAASSVRGSIQNTLVTVSEYEPADAAVVPIGDHPR